LADSQRRGTVMATEDTMRSSQPTYCVSERAKIYFPPAQTNYDRL